MSGQLHAPLALLPGEESLDTIRYEGWAPELFSCPSWESYIGCADHSSLLYRLSYSATKKQRMLHKPLIIIVEVGVEVNLRSTVSWPVCLSVRRPSGTRDQYFFLLEISLRQLRVCNLLYNCFWALPKRSLLGRSPAELTAIVYCLI
jgi:hypothetical protein